MPFAIRGIYLINICSVSLGFNTISYSIMFFNRCYPYHELPGIGKEWRASPAQITGQVGSWIGYVEGKNRKGE